MRGGGRVRGRPAPRPGLAIARLPCIPHHVDNQLGGHDAEADGGDGRKHEVQRAAALPGSCRSASLATCNGFGLLGMKGCIAVAIVACKSEETRPVAGALSSTGRCRPSRGYLTGLPEQAPRPLPLPTPGVSGRRQETTSRGVCSGRRSSHAIHCLHGPREGDRQFWLHQPISRLTALNLPARLAALISRICSCG